MKNRNCIIGQSGGPTAAINATLAGVISYAKKSSDFKNIYGMIYGIQGLLDGNYVDLLELFYDDEKIDALKHTPSMYLGSCRYKMPTYQEDDTIYIKLFAFFSKLQITDFFYIGGNDSMDTVMKLDDYAKYIKSDIHFIGIPKTVDNDLMGTDHTPGFGSAAKYVAASMLEIIHDSSIYDLESVTIVEIMGRNAGWLTAASALARNTYNDSPDLIYLPEHPFSLVKFINDVKTVLQRKQTVVIAVSEGIKTFDGLLVGMSKENMKKDAFGHFVSRGVIKTLEREIKNKIGCKVRGIEMNVLQRCAMHYASKRDLDESFTIGQCAVKSSLEGISGHVMGMHRILNTPYQIKYVSSDVRLVANKEQTIPLEWIDVEHSDITPMLYEYLLPLIHGEVTIPCSNGVPNYLYLEKRTTK